jgi:hypothetical protein
LLIQPALSPSCHPHPACVLTETANTPPLAGITCVEIEYEHASPGSAAIASTARNRSEFIQVF